MWSKALLEIIILSNNLFQPVAFFFKKNVITTDWYNCTCRKAILRFKWWTKNNRSHFARMLRTAHNKKYNFYRGMQLDNVLIVFLLIAFNTLQQVGLVVIVSTYHHKSTSLTLLIFLFDQLCSISGPRVKAGLHEGWGKLSKAWKLVCSVVTKFPRPAQPKNFYALEGTAQPNLGLSRDGVEVLRGHNSGR